MTPQAGPLLSVIIPARNEAAQIEGTVRAALRAAAALARVPESDVSLPAAGAEILVVDNASSDDTAARLSGMAERYGVRVVPCREPGAARARNAGAAAATGSVLVFVDADTRVPPESLRRIRDLVDRGGFGAGIFRLAPQAAGIRAWCWWAFWNNVRRLPLARAKAMPAFMFCTRGVFERYGPFDESVAIGEEWPILAGLYRAAPGRLVYDRSLTAHTSGRRMDRQPFGYLRTYVRYGLAVLARPARVRYADTIREDGATTSAAALPDASRPAGVRQG